MGHRQGVRREIGEQQQGVPLSASRILPVAAIADALGIIPIQQFEIAVANDRVSLAQGDELAIAVKRGVGTAQLLDGIYLDVIGVEDNPGRGRTESGVGAAVPLHRGTGVVAANGIEPPTQLGRSQP